MNDEQAWRKAIADQVRANCTIDFKPKRVDGKWVLTLQGDAVNWIDDHLPESHNAGDTLVAADEYFTTPVALTPTTEETGQ